MFYHWCYGYRHHEYDWLPGEFGQMEMGYGSGKANHAAFSTPEKSTTPMQSAAMYPTVMPQTIGTSFNIPLPNESMQMAVTSEMKANVQFPLAMSTAEEDKDRPMRMMIGPMTTGGKIRFKKFLALPFD
jgi:hypothetical protein